MSFKTLCFIFLMVQLILSLSQESLIKMSENSECIKAVVDSFIKKESCEKLSESHKSLVNQLLILACYQNDQLSQ